MLGLYGIVVRLNPMLIFARGRRAFSLAAVLMLFTALAHTLGNIRPITDPEQRLLITQMAALRLPLGLNLTPNIWDIYQDLMFTMSITFLGLGLVNLAIGSHRDSTPALLGRVSKINLVWVLGFTALAAVFQITPAIISGALILVAIVVILLYDAARLLYDEIAKGVHQITEKVASVVEESEKKAKK